MPAAKYHSPKPKREPPRAHGRPIRGSRAQVELRGVYDKDQLEFLRAIDRFKTDNNRPFPSWSEVLAVLMSLGYRKVDAPGPK